MNIDWSFWEWDTFLKDQDVVIIGSGLVGLQAALYLRQARPGFRITVLERGILPLGASTRNAGFACFGSMTELLDDLKTHTEEEIWELVDKRWKGLQKLRALIGDSVMDLDISGGYELFRDQDEESFRECADKIDGFNGRFRQITGLPGIFQIWDHRLPETGFRGIRHLIRNSAEGQVHTGKLVLALFQKAKDAGIQVLNGANVLKLEEEAGKVNIFLENNQRMEARQVLVATNGFAARLFPQLAVVPARNQVLITRELPGLPFHGTFHYDKGYVYFRNVGNRVLLGGGRNMDFETEQTDVLDLTEPIQNNLLRLLREIIIPGQPFEVERWWSGIMGLGPKKKTLIQSLSDRIHVAVRLGGMGVAIGSLVAEEGANLLLKENRGV